MSFAGRPSAAGCFPPSSTANASLYSATRCGPQWITIGKLDAKQPRVIVRSTGDQDPTGPNGFADQSMARINSRTGPGPSNTPTPGSDDTIDAPCLSTLNKDGPIPGIVGTMPTPRTASSTPACWCGRASTQRQGSRPARRLRPDWPAGSIWTNQANGSSSGQRPRSSTGQSPAPVD